MSASNVRGCYIIDRASAFNIGILFVAPVDTFNAGKFSIQTRIIGRISIITLEKS
jgi:hypothetical protein